jgi:hypothetical protein
MEFGTCRDDVPAGLEDNALAQIYLTLSVVVAYER